MNFFKSEKHASGKDGLQIDEVQEGFLFRYYLGQYTAVRMENQVVFFNHDIHNIINWLAEGYTQAFSTYPSGTIVSFIQE